MIVTVFRIDKERIAVNIALARTHVIDTTEPCPATEQVTVGIVPENYIADIGFGVVGGLDAVYVINYRQIADGRRAAGDEDCHKVVFYNKIPQDAVRALTTVKGYREIIGIPEHRHAGCAGSDTLHNERFAPKIDFLLVQTRKDLYYITF